MRKWTEKEALAALNGDVKVIGKTIIVTGGFKGLKACSARDYLVNHCGYYSIMKERITNDGL